MVDYPACEVTDPAANAARLIANNQRPAVLVVDQGRPVAVLPASQVLNFVIPIYLQEDPSLVRAFDEAAADACATSMTGKTVGDMLTKSRRTPMPLVGLEATLMECAAKMARDHSPLLVVVDAEQKVLGTITATRLLGVLLG
jgi:CBS domain-containing protein